MSIILEAGLDDTGQIRKIADENYRARNRPTDVGAIAVTAALAVAVALWAYPALDNDRFSIDSSRWAMAAASVLSAIVATFCGVYILDRRNRNRHNEVMAHIDSLRTLACHNGSGIGQLADRLEARPVPPTAEQVDAIEPADVHQLARDAYRLGRRSRPASE